MIIVYFSGSHPIPYLPLTFCGNFNIDTLQENALLKKYLNCILSNGYEVFAKSATRETDTSSTCLDHFVYQNINLLNCEILKKIKLFQTTIQLIEHAE